MDEPYIDRKDAGRQLAERLLHYTGAPDVIVLALPRGGVPVGYEVAHRLLAPLDVFLVRKLGTPGHEELAMGAIASGNVTVLNSDVVRSLGITRETIERVAAHERRELERREREYRGGHPAPEIRGHTAILVDDGLATGATMLAAVRALRQEDAARVVVAVPVAARRTCNALGEHVDEIICARTPPDFVAVGEWYIDFSQTTDAEVRDLLARAELERSPLQGAGR